jgi:hypothetical protein
MVAYAYLTFLEVATDFPDLCQISSVLPVHVNVS